LHSFKNIPCECVLGDLMFENVGNVLKASVLAICIGIVLVIISIILKLIPALIIGSEFVDIITLISAAYEFLMLFIFLLLYFWTGMRAVKRFGLDVVGAGGASAVAFVVTGIVNLILSALLGVLMLSHVLPPTGLVSPEAVVVASIFGDAAKGAVGLGLSNLCGIVFLAVGALINFAIGGFGGLFAHR